MKSFRTTAIAFVLVAAAVAGAVIWKTQGDSMTGSGSPTANRKRNTTFIATSIDTSWGNNGFAMMTQPLGFQIADSDAMLNGVVYSVGTAVTPKGLRAVVARTVDGRTVDYAYAINPANETLGYYGEFNQSTGQRISVDSAGNVWVAGQAVVPAGANPGRYDFVTQLSPTLGYWHQPTDNVCSSVCGKVYPASTRINDLQVNFGGNRVLVATSANMYMYAATTGASLPVGTTNFPNNSGETDCAMLPTHLDDDPVNKSFVAVSADAEKKSLLLIDYTATLVDCARVWMNTNVSSIDAYGGQVVVFGKFFGSLTFSTFLNSSTGILEDYNQLVEVDEQAGGNPWVAGQAVSTLQDHYYGSFTVQGSSPTTYVVDFDSKGRRSTVFSSLSSATTGALRSDPPPQLTRAPVGMTVASSYVDRSNTATALAVRLAAGSDGMLTAPVFPSAEQNISVTYGQQNSIPFARATNGVSYSLASGSLPAGVSLTSSGDLTGTPQSTGYFTAKVSATNSAGTSQTTLFINSAAKAPGAPTITGIDYGDPINFLRYVTGTPGSDKDKIALNYVDTKGVEVHQPCLYGTCVIPNVNIPENKDVTVTLLQSNDAGSTDAVNSMVIRRKVLPDPVTNLSAKGTTFGASVKFTAPVDVHNTGILTYLATVTNVGDKSVVKKYWGCTPDDCELTGLPAGNGFVVTITVVSEAGDVESDKSPQFTVNAPAPEKKGPKLGTTDITVPAHEDFVLPLVATGTGDISFEVNWDDLPRGADFDGETNTISGALDPGTYVITYSSTDSNGTTEGSVMVTVTPGQLKAPGMMPSFSTYDRKFSVFPFYKRYQDMYAADHFEWTSTVTVNGAVSTKSGSCGPGSKCTLPNAVWGEDLTLTMKAVPVEDSGDTESETNTFVIHVPDLPPAVPTGKLAFERMPDASPTTAVLMGHVRMKPSMKFPLSLSASATVQVDATTSCDVINEDLVLRLEGPRNGCSVDPLINLWMGDEIIGADDDSGAANVPVGTDQDGNELWDAYNILSSRLSTQVEAGDYLIEATSITDLLRNDDIRLAESDVEYDLWVTIITTPAEADRLMAKSITGAASPQPSAQPQKLESDPANEIVPPADLKPAAGNALPAPTQGPDVPATAQSVVSLSVDPGPKELKVAPVTLGGSSDPVKVTATPGGASCSAKPGQTCTISGLSPWINYTVSAGGSPVSQSATPALQLKPGSKVKVSSLGLSAAAKTLKVALKMGSVRVSGSCALNAARTSISVGKSGNCMITAQTTKKVKATAANGPSLSVSAQIG